MLNSPGSMDDGRPRTAQAGRNAAPALHRCIACRRADNGCGNGSRWAATSATAARRPPGFLPALHRDSALESHRSAALYMGARGLRTVAPTGLLRTAAPDT